MTYSVDSWHRNRPSSRKSRIARWSKNPVGAIIRLIEYIALGLPLISIVKSAQQFEQIKHLNPQVKFDTEIDAYFVDCCRIDIETNMLGLSSGHVFAPRFGSHTFLSGQFLANIRRLRTKKYTKCFSQIIPVPSQAYYFHFIVEELPSIIKLSRIYPDHRFLLHDSQPGYVFDALDFLKINYLRTEEKILKIENSIIYAYNDILNESSLKRVKNSFLGTEDSDHLEDRILLLRSGLDREQTSEDLTVIEKLVQLNFKIVNLDILSIYEQAKLFSNAKYIIGMHGGALTNLIFCNSNASVFEVFNHDYRNMDYADICTKYHIDYKSGDWEDLNQVIKDWTLPPVIAPGNQE